MYRKTIAVTPLGERIYLFFEKIRFASQKLNFSKTILAKISKNNLK
jgi:hypothetical protein